MEQLLMEKCELFVENKNRIDHSFSWSLIQVILPSAQLMTNRNILANEERLKAMEQIVKSKTGAFSDLRGTVLLPLICKMSMAKEPAEYLDHVQTVYKMLNLSKWFGSEYKILAAMTIVDKVTGVYNNSINEIADEQAFAHYVNKTNEIYSRMKQEHKWLTSDEDTPLAAVLAVSDMEVDGLIDEMEECYKLLKKKFSDNNAVQSLSHVLALSQKNITEKVEKVAAIYDILRANKHGFGSGYELSVLGSLAMLDNPAEEIADCIIEVDEYLKGQKGFGGLSLTAKERRFFAAQLTKNYYHPEEQNTECAMLGSMVALVIAIELCMMVCVTTM